MHFMGYDLPKGMFLYICIYLTHHRSDIYPEPKLFKPERFLERLYSSTPPPSIFIVKVVIDL
ncbi:cytochrome P450 [Dendronalium sp. ChiSLP03b]|uniref:cytochrome P450 n=1 Tax=Dendronalium sp. ChiSLP03b TaxID=3075381 RepID=UPI00391A196E